MSTLIVYYAHPGHSHSQANRLMCKYAKTVEHITHVDLYAEYPRFDINVDREQQRLCEHDTVVFQFPLFWYSPPSLIKEWMDLVLEYGFAYGTNGNCLENKTLLLAITAAGPEEAYTTQGYQCYSLREFIRPFEQTARLCGMRFQPPYVLYGSLQASMTTQLIPHANGYKLLLEALRDNQKDIFTVDSDVIQSHHINIPNGL